MFVCVCVCHGCRGQDRGKKIGPLIVLWAFVGPSKIEHVTGTGRRKKKTFQAPQGLVGFFVGPSGFEHVTGMGRWKRSIRAPESFVGFCGTRRVRACDRDRELSRKQLLQQ